MAIRQYWTVKTDDGMHDLSYTYSRWTGKSVLTIDGESFVQNLRSFRIAVARREVFRLGDEQCVLEVSGNGRAAVICRGKTVPEKQAPGSPSDRGQETIRR